MPLTRNQKEQMLAELTDRVSRAKAALVADYAGLTVAQVTEIRRAFRAAGVDYRVVKNTLFKRVVKGTPREAISKAFSRTTAVAFKFDEEFGKLGKVAQELSKKFEKLKFKAGFVENDIMHEAALAKMAALPTLDEARAQLLGVINAPASKLLATINAPASHVVGVIQAKVDKDKGA
ncbi:MAG: 50S ribosomal protein L10 [Deltaproteobacteria bacterium]|nr:50S ribosomal protein L10 [Deltaproteobacteria bacterium]